MRQHRAATRRPLKSPWRRLLGLLVATMALARAACFARPALGPQASGASGAAGRQPRSRVLRRASGADAGEGYSYTPFKWMVDFGIADEELEAVIARVPSLDRAWPDSSKSLMREDFRTFVTGGGSSGLKDAAIDAVFNSMGGSSGVIVPSVREQVAEAVEGWRPSPGRAVDLLAVQKGILWARSQIIGAWLFLNVFSVYAGYFVIGRPILYQLFGIDLLPNLVRFWEAPS
mmetsp:Transcript_152751/g.470352  ORF Transcript_152751/g.470352 Transcript_152751/m.470352 type:complete len:231 (+) Transcript_152751:59-751(+)